MTVRGRRTAAVAQDETLDVGHDRTVRVRGCATTTVGQHDAPRSHVLHVEGTARQSSTGRTEIVSDREIVLRCGRSTLVLHPDRIELDAPRIVTTGGGSRLTLAEDRVRVRTTGRALFLADGLLLRAASGASVSLNSDASVNGARVLLRSPASASDTVTDDTPPPTRIELVDAQGAPIPNQRYRITFPDGTAQTGVLDRHGRAEIETDTEGEITFPDLGPAEEG